MSELYAVIQVHPERRYDYKMDTIRESFSVGLPYVFSDHKRAYQAAEEKRKAHVPCFVKEFPFNPLDKRLETLEAKVQSDADYIVDLEQSVKELEEENVRLRSCLSDDAENARQIMGENAKLRELAKNLYECNGSCERCVELTGRCEYKEQLRELGIEVEDD